MSQTYLVSLLRTGQTVPVKVFDCYADAFEFCRQCTPANNDSYLLKTADYEPIRRAIETCCPEGLGADVKALGWTITGFYAGGCVGLHETITGDEHEFPDWHVGQYECPAASG